MRHLEDILLILTLSLPTYFFWRWLYKKFVKNRLKYHAATWGSTIFITPFIYAAAVYTLLFWMCYYPNRNFETQQWIERPEKRYEMGSNMVESHILIGKTEEQVKAQLGNKDRFDGPNVWCYYLGLRPGFDIDGEILLIEFKNAKVIKVIKVQG